MEVEEGSVSFQTSSPTSLSTEGHLLITFANNLDPDQARQNVGARSGSKLFDSPMVFLKEFFEKNDFEKKSAADKKA